MKKIAVIVNGCGHRDGSEIHEVVFTLLAIEERGWTWECLALNQPQASVIDHTTGAVIPEESRNMLKESARLARGRVKDLAAAHTSDYAAVIIPGGSGTAKNLCNFALAGVEMTVNERVADCLRSFHAAKKPLGAICIAPVILAKVFGNEAVKITLGATDNDASKVAVSLGAQVVVCGANDCVVDHRHKVITTPAYMLDARMVDVATGIRKLVGEVIAMAAT